MNPNDGKFRIGDTVRLNSGSPALTVTHVESERIQVTWIGADGNLNVWFAPTACFVRDAE